MFLKHWYRFTTYTRFLPVFQIADLIVLTFRQKFLPSDQQRCLSWTLPTNHPDAKMYTLAVVDAEGHGQPVDHAVLANFIVLVLFNLKNISNTVNSPPVEYTCDSLLRLVFVFQCTERQQVRENVYLSQTHSHSYNKQRTDDGRQSF